MAALKIRPFTLADQRVIACWRYEPPYDCYDVKYDTGELWPDHHALEEDGHLVGFCSFGPDAQVPGGRYPDGPLDMGMGIHPALTGQGRGARYLAAVLGFATDMLRSPMQRATIADFNTRALRLCERAGFRRLGRFEGNDRPYWILLRA